jgi:hypothetical protein
MNAGGTGSSETVYFELIDAIPQSLLPVWVNFALGRASERFPIYSAGSTLLRSQLIGMSIEEPADGKQRFVPVNIGRSLCASLFWF